jgi:hypothetical protein
VVTMSYPISSPACREIAEYGRTRIAPTVRSVVRISSGSGRCVVASGAASPSSEAIQCAAGRGVAVELDAG